MDAACISMTDYFSAFSTKNDGRYRLDQFVIFFFVGLFSACEWKTFPFLAGVMYMDCLLFPKF